MVELLFFTKWCQHLAGPLLVVRVVAKAVLQYLRYRVEFYTASTLHGGFAGTAESFVGVEHAFGVTAVVAGRS